MFSVWSSLLSRHGETSKYNFGSCSVLRSWKAATQHFVTDFSLIWAETSNLNVIASILIYFFFPETYWLEGTLSFKICSAYYSYIQIFLLTQHGTACYNILNILLEWAGGFHVLQVHWFQLQMILNPKLLVLLLWFHMWFLLCSYALQS